MFVLNEGRLSEKLQMCAKAYKEPPYGREVEGTVELFEEAAEKLAEYEDLEEQGLLLRLPCKVGSVVYEIKDDCEYCGDCYTKQLCRDCEYRNLYTEECELCSETAIVLRLSQFGKTVFLTKSEAEEKLRELEGK